MILPFSTQLNGKPTYFVEKIWAALECQFAETTTKCIKYIFPPEYFECLDKGFKNTTEFRPKIHTIREDKKNRWKPGVMIDFFINARQKNMFRFAPRIPVVSVQKIEIEYILNLRPDVFTHLGQRKDHYYPIIHIDDKTLFDDGIIAFLAINDGFDDGEDFFEYFNTDYTGKIIHWTDKRY
ncbi:MAG: hypothetical protein C0525_01455 [Flavobacterium sp.]|uniref:hypothetical protein n=1 Tax=Flavobacterium sp. TaxID=239 RepID=UPI0025B8BF58|nr:hypothetical protein [Flavobacterium sp.]MBA4133367.1 hypothetical protein [Flavobacterium sp.]